MAFSIDELTRQVSEQVDAALEKSREIDRLSGRIVDGAATYADVERLASLTGTSTGRVLADALVQHAVDGKVAEDVARAILAKPLEDNYELIAEACRLTQEALNRKAGLGLQAVKPEMPRDRINGLVTETAGKNDIGSFAGRLVQQVENLSTSTVDESVRVNAAAHSRAGLHPKIRRITDGKCCKWCSALAGTYDYDDVSDTGNDVFRRHANCGCQVLYDPADGSRMQDAHSKRLLSAEESAKIEARKTYGLDEISVDGAIRTVKKLFGSQNDGFRSNKSFLRKKCGLIPDKSLREVDQELLKSCSNQIEILNNRFEAIPRGDMLFYYDENVKYTAAVSIDNAELVLSSKFCNRKELINEIRDRVTNKEYMPCKMDDDTLSRYAITHEYGHILHNTLFDRAKNQGYSKSRNDFLEDCYNEIIAIAKKNNIHFSYSNSISAYGSRNNNRAEFFAECFANSQLGYPNDLGNAMKEWLKQKGL